MRLLILLLATAGTVYASDPFQQQDELVGDPNVSYGSTEFSPDFQYLVWGEYAADGTDNMVMWHCGVDPDTGDLIPWDGKGFRAFESTGWGRANTPGRDSQGIYYAGLNRMGQIVLVRPTGATTGNVTVLPTPVDISRRAVYGMDLPIDYTGLGYVFWISNSEGIVAGPGDPRVTNVQLKYIDLSNPAVEHTLQDQQRPPVAGGFAPLDIAFPRNIRGTSLLTSGVRLETGIQVVEFDLAHADPDARLITSDATTKSDAFAFTFGEQLVMLSGNNSLEGATQVYTRQTPAQFFQPVEVITPQVANLEPPLFAQSNEFAILEERAYTAFQVNSREDDFFGTTFQQTGEIWIATVLQAPQQQWLLSEENDWAKFEPEPFVGNDRIWVFYSSCPKGSELRTATINLRRCATPIQAVNPYSASSWIIR